MMAHTSNIAITFVAVSVMRKLNWDWGWADDHTDGGNSMHDGSHRTLQGSQC